MGEDLSIEEIIEHTQQRMDKTLDSFHSELRKLRTGRASPALVEQIKVDYYDTQTPLNQLTTISVPEPRTIIIQPWDVSSIGNIEKAIMKSDLGINPSNDGKVIRLSIPILTEERRKELVKYVGKLAEEYRVSIRQIRKDANNTIKEGEKNKQFTEDEVKKYLNKTQEMTDSFIEKIKSALESKEKEIMEV